MTREQTVILGTLKTYPGLPLSAADVADETGLKVPTVARILSRFALSYTVQRKLQTNALGHAVWHY